MLIIISMLALLMLTATVSDGDNTYAEDCFVPIAVRLLCPPSSGRFEDPWADEETVLGHPEKDVLSYLETCASALGLALDLEAKNCSLRTLRSVTAGEIGAGSGKDSGVQKNGVVESAEGSINKTATVSSAQDVYAAVTTALSRALVHCKRFEVCRGKPKKRTASM